MGRLFYFNTGLTNKNLISKESKSKDKNILTMSIFFLLNLQIKLIDYTKQNYKNSLLPRLIWIVNSIY